MLASLVAVGAVASSRSLAADDPQISYSDFIHLEMRNGAGGKVARFDRILEMPGKGYRWDNPGARVRFCTDAAQVTAKFTVSGLHVSTTARNAIGFCVVDGQWQRWPEVVPDARDGHPRDFELKFQAPAGGSWHTYELVFPYGEAIDFRGLAVDGEAHFEAPASRPAFRYLAYGDSITHGFSASQVTASYAFRVAEQKHWQLLNLGLGGRSSNPADGALVGSLKVDLISVMMGANDWQVGVSLDDYRRNMTAFFEAIRAAQPTVPIFAITSLWVHDSWQPAKQVAPLEKYRQVLRDVVRAHADSNIHLVEGPTLIDHDLKYFDAAPIHPNDAGFAQMAERLNRLF